MESVDNSAIAKLSKAAQELSFETKRLQRNLQKFHKFQCSLLVVSREWMQLLEQENHTAQESRIPEEQTQT